MAVRKGGGVMKRFAGFFACLFAVILCMPVFAAEPIKMGAVINLTGPASSWGKFHAKGLQDYIKYVNEVKGGVGGAKIDLTVADHAYKVAEGINHVKKFCEDGMVMIATWDTGLGIQVKPIIKEYKVPTINFSTGQEILKPPIDYMYLPFGSYVLDSYAVLEYVKAIHKGKDKPKVGLLTLDNAYGKSIHDPSKQFAAKEGLQIVDIEEFPPKTVDLSTVLMKLKQAGAEYVFTQILPANMISALKASDQTGFKPLFIGTWTATDPDFFAAAKGLIKDRLEMQFVGCLPGDGTPGVKLMEELIQRYKSVDRYDLSYWEGVAIGMIMVRGAERAKEKFGKITSETINQALETFRNEDFGGIVPNITYTKDDHQGSFVGRIIKVNDDGTFTPLTNFFSPGKGELKLLKGK
jgi:branched-chain amino acid transport system substrate-binding protein